MTRTIAAIADRAASILPALLAAVLVSCSGAVSGPPAVNDPTRITILPADATLYSGLPTTFVISGGTGAYFVSSSNQSVVPVSGALSGTTLLVVPNPVAVDTTVTLTVRDTGATPTASATLTVHPGTVSNNVTITPTSTQAAACDPAICSGGDAQVSVTISQGGIPLAARGVRFDVVSGDYRFITSPPGAATETLATTITVVTDQSGLAQARIRVTAGAANQTALLLITDIASGAFQNASFIIAQSTGTSPGFFVIPDTITFTGPNNTSCANNASAEAVIFGGVPPYAVSGAGSGFSVSPSVVANSGGSIGILALGVCTAGLPIVVQDASGHSATVTVVNELGTVTAPVLVVSPNAVTLDSCLSSASATIAGGTGNNYIVSSGSSGVFARLASPTTVSIQRTPNTPATTSPVTVSVSDGVSTVPITVTLGTNAAGACPEPLTVSSPITVTGCATTAVTLAGGNGSYSAISNDPAVSAAVTGSVLTLQQNPSVAHSGTPTVTVLSGTQQRTVTVISSGTCP